MRIAHVINHFMPELGYTEYYLAKKQHEMGHQICIITSDHHIADSKKRYSEGSFLIEGGIKVFRLPTLIESSDEVLVPVNRLKEILIAFSPHVVHIHGALSPMAFTCALHKREIGYKIVADVITGMVTAHGLSLAVKTAILKMYVKTIWPTVYNKVDCFFALSEASLDWMRDMLNLDTSRVQFIPLGADSDLFCFDPHKRRAVREKLGVTDNEVLAIYTGKLLPHKRLDALFYASAPLIRAGNDFRILIVGEGTDQYVNHLRLITNNLNINRNVIFHHAVHRTELPSFYSAADFAVWPGSPSISIIEAMSTSLPVIIARSKWTNHLLEYGNGFDFSEGDVEALRACIQSLLENDDLRQKMGETSRKIVEEKLNWNNIARQYIEAYRLPSAK